MSVPPRSRQARRLAESALVRIVHSYGMTPQVVLLGGLMPDFLCSRAGTLHIGTTDVDLQVDPEIAAGSTNAKRLETALRQAEFAPDDERPWRWLDQTAPGAAAKIEFLTDLDDVPDRATVTFDNCEYLGAANLRGLVSPDATGRRGSSSALSMEPRFRSSSGWQGSPGTCLPRPTPRTVDVRPKTGMTLPMCYFTMTMVAQLRPARECAIGSASN